MGGIFWHRENIYVRNLLHKKDTGELREGGKEYQSHDPPGYQVMFLFRIEWNFFGNSESYWVIEYRKETPKLLIFTSFEHWRVSKQKIKSVLLSRIRWPDKITFFRFWRNSLLDGHFRIAFHPEIDSSFAIIAELMLPRTKYSNVWSSPNPSCHTLNASRIILCVKVSTFSWRIT